ncbi:MAG: tRNA preQ1(34) S-adenosylmethionine ribosyltransferase-isomerase QueA [Thermodesulfobacteriota bacterium]
MVSSLSEYEFALPSELIAQEPIEQRDQSRLMVLERKTGDRQHKAFYQILEYLHPGDVLVINDTRVVPARLLGKKKSGGGVECLILHYPGSQVRDSFTTPCLIKSRGKIRPGEFIFFDENLEGEIQPTSPDGTALVTFRFQGTLESVLQKSGHVPLPPYIHRKEKDPALQETDRNRYQTVFARNPGAVAAPTAGLHFSAKLMASLREKGVFWVPLTLHVGYGTFAPIKSENIEAHKMHSESYFLSAEAARTILEQKSQGRRIIAVGTTSTRVLEYQAQKYGTLKAEEGHCDLFIKPGFSFRIIDGLITNFHLPRTTLLLLVSAFAGRDNILKAYQEAVKRNYRFYSYGDAMMII